MGVDSLLNPNTAGVNATVAAPDVITSAITPALGDGSTPCVLDVSAVLAAVVVYNLTHAARSV